MVSKTADRLGGGDQTANSPKPKGIPTSKFGVNQQSKASVSKSNTNNKSPGSYPLKQGLPGNRPTAPAKRDKPRPATPLRDPKSTGAFAAALVNQSSSNSVTSKFDKGSIKAKETGGDLLNSQSKSTVQSFDAAKRLLQTRPQSSKSPRSVTPPQARPVGSTGNAQAKTEKLLLGRKSPAHAAGALLLSTTR